MSLVIGVDPGNFGGVCAIDQVSGNIEACVKMPAKGSKFDPEGLVELFRMWRCEILGDAQKVNLATERLFPTGVTSKISCMSMGRSMGAIEVAARSVFHGRLESFHEIRPQVWQKVMHKGFPKGHDRKLLSEIEAQARQPDFDWPCGPQTKRILDGPVEAYLIGEWLRLEMVG